MRRHLEENMSNPNTKLVFVLHKTLNLTQKKIASPSHEAKFMVIVTLELTFL
jgi:hypothetical protein